MGPLTFFAGFTCDHENSQLLLWYFIAFAIVAALAFLVGYFGIRKIKIKWLAILLYILLGLAGFVGWHILYWEMMGSGNLFGCGLSPFFR